MSVKTAITFSLSWSVSSDSVGSCEVLWGEISQQNVLMRMRTVPPSLTAVIINTKMEQEEDSRHIGSLQTQEMQLGVQPMTLSLELPWKQEIMSDYVTWYEQKCKQITSFSSICPSQFWQYVISSSIDIARAGRIERGRREEVVGMEALANSTEKETLPYYFKLL